MKPNPLKQLLALAVALPCAAPASAATPAEEAWWWPTLEPPNAVLRTTPVETFEDPPPGTPGSTTDPQPAPDLGPTHMLVQSAAGLAAAAVQRGELDEMVWITTRNPNQELAFDRMLARLSLEDRGEIEPWDLVARLRDAGVLKGYILYRYDRSARGPHQGGELDASVNVATSLAGLLGGVIVDESLEARARDLGLSRLADARDKDIRWVFDTHRDRLNRRTVMLQDPKLPHNRDYAIAHRVLVLYDQAEPTPTVLAWLEPLSPILGWNRGDEGANARLFSQYGHFNTATDWAMNLPLLSAGAADARTPRFPSGNGSEHAASGGEETSGGAVAFVMSDGDNLQWMVQNFFKSGPRRYWDSPDHGRFPVTWTLCLAHLRQAAPDLLQYAAETLAPNASVVEFGGGYYFPDHFGELREEPDLLARQARRTWAHMQAVGVDTLCLIFGDLDSDAARQAYATYAREMPGLRGILAMEYHPYHAGEGRVFWIPRDPGPPLPVVTCRLQLRTDFEMPGAAGIETTTQTLNPPGSSAPGTPAPGTPESSNPANNQWVVAHAWSSFPPPRDASRHGTSGVSGASGGGGEGVTGLTPIGWTVDRLDPSLDVVTAQQLIDRLVRSRGFGGSNGVAE